MPVAGIGVRAWSAAFELSRKARSFAAKHQALRKAVARRGNGPDELPVILAHMRNLYRKSTRVTARRKVRGLNRRGVRGRRRGLRAHRRLAPARPEFL